MKLLELFLVETTEEDRAIVSLASSIFQELEKYAKEEDPYQPSPEVPTLDEPDDLYEKKSKEDVVVGTIGELFDTPLKVLDSIGIEIWPNNDLTRYANDIPDDKSLEGVPKTGGLWDGDKNKIIFNEDFLGTPQLRSWIVHELRHALDDKKSEYRANISSRYATPKKSVAKHATTPHLKYQAQPREINARFGEVLNTMVAAIKYAVKNLPKEEIRDYIWKEFEESLVYHEIAQFFPERTKSKDYKRLIKRAVDFMQKEVQYQMSL
jgi:hypothetical protein